MRATANAGFAVHATGSAQACVLWALDTGGDKTSIGVRSSGTGRFRAVGEGDATLENQNGPDRRRRKQVSHVSQGYLRTAIDFIDTVIGKFPFRIHTVPTRL